MLGISPHWVVKLGILLTAVALSVEVAAQQNSNESRTRDPELLPGGPCPSSVLDFDRLVSLLGSDNATERWAAAECLGDMKDTRAIDPLVGAIFREKYPRLVMIEQNALRGMVNPHAEDLLLEALRQKKTRATAVYTLGTLQVERAVDPLIALLKSPDKWDRSDAAEALGLIKDPRATGPVSATLKDPDEVVRRFAASALGDLGDVRAVGPLSDVLKDPDDGVRWNASNSLGDLKDSRATAPLATALSDRQENVRRAAADALGKIRDSRAVLALIVAFKSGNRWHAAAALANISDSRAAEFLNSGLNERQFDLVAAAHLFFIRKGDPHSLQALIEALNKYGRWEMAQAYMYCGNPQLGDAARRWAASHDYENLTPSDGPPLTWGSEKQSAP